MVERSGKSSGVRLAIFAAVTVLPLGVIVPIGPDSLAEAGTAPLSGGGYTAFLASGTGTSLSAVTAAAPGAPEIPPIAAPTGGVIRQLAIDPRAQEVLATIAPVPGSALAGIQAYSAQTGQPIGGVVALPLAYPGPIAITPDGSTAWVGDWGGSHVVSVAVNPGGIPAAGAASITLPLPTGRRANLESDVACSLAIGPSGAELYVGASTTDAAAGPTGPQGPQGLCSSSPDGASQNVVYAYGQAGAGAGPTGPVWADDVTADAPGALDAMSVTPNGETLYVASHEVTFDFPDATPGAVLALNGLPGSPTTTVVNVPGYPGESTPSSNTNRTPAFDPVALAMTPDGSTLYVADAGGWVPPCVGFVAACPPGGPGELDAVPTNGAPASGPLLITTPAGAPSGLAVTPDGRTILLSATQATTALPASTVLAPTTPFTPGAAPGASAVAITPDQAPVASVSASPPSGNPGVTVTFNASGSTVLYGAITQYVWNFGDGSPPVSSGTPTVTHVYGTAGTYTATVVETDGAGTSVPPALASFPVDFTGQTASKRADPSAQAAVGIAITNPPPPPPTIPTITTLPSTTATTAAPTTVTTRPTTTTHPTTTTTKPTTTLPTTTTSRPPPPPGSPVLTVNPGIGPPGIVTQFSGQNFPDNTVITLQWSPGIGSTVVTSGPTGALSGTMLVMYRDQIGNRDLVAVGFPTAVAPFLVVPDSSDPAGSSDQFLFRR
jgi:PKD domain